MGPCTSTKDKSISNYRFQNNFNYEVRNNLYSNNGYRGYPVNILKDGTIQQPQIKQNSTDPQNQPNQSSYIQNEVSIDNLEPQINVSKVNTIEQPQIKQNSTDPQNQPNQPSYIQNEVSIDNLEPQINVSKVNTIEQPQIKQNSTDPQNQPNQPSYIQSEVCVGGLEPQINVSKIEPNQQNNIIHSKKHSTCFRVQGCHEFETKNRNYNIQNILIQPSNSYQVQIEIKVPDFPNLDFIKSMDGNLTLLEVEKISKNENFIFDRDMSIRNLNKTLLELQNNLSNKKSHLTFKLLHISDKLIKDLEESEINFINIGGESCYQSSTLQGFVHFLFPLAIKNINIERQKRKLEKVLDLDELKNNDIFNNTVIDTLKGIIKIQGCGKGGVDENGQKSYLASKLFECSSNI